MPLIPDRSPTHPVSALAGALVALLVAIASAGCGPGDELETIRQQQDSGDYEVTIEPLRELLSERPDDPEVNYRYGHALVMTGRQSIATWALRKAMDDREWTVAAGLQLAFAGLATGDFNEVVDAANHVLELEPDNTTALLLRANAYAYWRNDPIQALADAARVLELEPDAIDAMKPHILALLQIGEDEAAGKAIEELGKRLAESDAPESTDAWYCATRAVFREESGDLKGARKLWAECLEAHPDSADVVVTAVDFYDGQGESGRSIEVLRSALARMPAAQTFRIVLAERLRRSGAVAEGDALLVEATHQEDRQLAAAAWLDLGRYRRNAFEPAGAAEAMAHALELAREAGPVPPQYPFEYAEALLLSKQFERALEVAEDLPVPAHRHMIRARVAQERGDPALALKEFTKSFRLWPDNATGRYYAGRAAEQVGDFDRALEEYRNSIRIDPGATDSRTRAATLLVAEGQPRFASQLLRELAGRPLEASGQLLAVQVAGRFGGAQEIRAAINRFVRTGSGSPAIAAAEIACGAPQGSRDPSGVLRLLRELDGVDFRDPGQAAALRTLVRCSREAGERATPRELRSALAKHPDIGAFQEIRGLDLELAGEVEPARAAYTRALELEPDNARALAGLGRLSLAADPAQAVGFFDRAAAADPGDPAPKLAAARALIASGKRDDAAVRLDALLSQHPLEAEAAALRASLDLERGTATSETLERARRAVRFGGGLEALAVLSRVHTERGETDQAEQIAKRVEALREKAEGKSSDPRG